jgi:hypothetical protein
MNNIINKNNTLIILDWDDTLFPTNWFLQNNINLKDDIEKKENISYFMELDNVLSKLLKHLKNYGNVTIITNAMTEWINTSSSALPKTKKILETLNIVSARGNYQMTHPNINDWKKQAFKANKRHYINIISVGDAHYEYNALIGLYDKKNDILLKSIKFINEPLHEILIDQLEVLNNIVPDICKMNKHMDLKFKLKHEVKLIKKNK